MSKPPFVVGFIGLGKMGAPMAGRLIAAGFRTLLWNRSAAKLEDLLRAGGEKAESPADLMARSDVVCLCVTDGAAVEAVACGEHGLFTAPRDESSPPKYVIDFSSIDPDAAVALARRAAEARISWIDAPVSGGVPGAESGKLIVFAGGDAGAIAALQPVFAALASKVTHMGPSGSGQVTKVCNQMIVACNMLLIAETLAAARRAGVDVARLPSALAGGFADSLPLQIFGPRMAHHQFEPVLGGIHLMEKDIGLARKMVLAGQSFAPLSALCAELYRGIRSDSRVGLDEDLSALIKLFEPD